MPILILVLRVILEEQDDFYKLAETKWWHLIAKDKVFRVIIMNIQQTQNITQNNINHRNPQHWLVGHGVPRREINDLLNSYLIRRVLISSKQKSNLNNQN